MGKANPEDKAVCTIVKHTALDELAAGLKEKASHHGEESEEAQANLKEI